MPTADATPRTPPPLLDLPALRRRTLDHSWGLAIDALVMVGPVANAKALVVLIVLLRLHPKKSAPCP